LTRTGATGSIDRFYIIHVTEACRHLSEERTITAGCWGFPSLFAECLLPSGIAHFLGGISSWPRIIMPGYLRVSWFSRVLTGRTAWIAQVICLATSCVLEGCVSSPGSDNNFLFSATFRPLLGPTQPPLPLVSRAISPGVKLPGR
jgi:hypothetical protein